MCDEMESVLGAVDGVFLGADTKIQSGDVLSICVEERTPANLVAVPVIRRGEQVIYLSPTSAPPFTMPTSGLVTRPVVLENCVERVGP